MNSTTNLKGVIDIVATYMNYAVELLMGLAVVMFVFYVIRYFMRPSDNRGEAAQYVMWSLIGFFVILSFWGIVNILTGTFGFAQNTPGSWSSFSNIFPK
jgi:apolipoprotein N-acyltransferase